MIDAIKNRWGGISPSKQKTLTIMGILLVIVIAGLIGYLITKDTQEEALQAQIDEDRRNIMLDTELLQRGLFHEQTRDMELLRGQMEAMQVEREAERTNEAQRQDLLQVLPPLPPFPAPTPTPMPFPQPLPLPPQQLGQPVNEFPPPPPVLIGGISIVSNLNIPQVQEEEVKKKERTVYLPPSFMEAHLLSGLNAPTMGDAMGNPVPVILRVNDIAVLPNSVRADLKGCFIIADGIGSLADERAHMRLVSLSCIAKNGHAVIDQRISGFIVDNDGKIGLRGNVVSKMGGAIARTFLAGMFGGLGEAIRQQGMATAISPLGATQVMGDGLQNIGLAGLGTGLATSLEKLQGFYLRLAEQAIPVIEIGAGREVTIVISQGTELIIKDYCVGGREC